MDLDSIRQRLDFERRTLARDGQDIEILPQLTRSRSKDGFRHAVEFSSLSAADADAAIATQLSHFQALGVEAEWTICGHDRPSDLLDRLARHGFEIGPRETVVVFDLRNRPVWINDSTPHVVSRVENLDQLDVYRRAELAVFPESSQYGFNQLSRNIRASSTRQTGYIAFMDGCPASIGRLDTHPESWFAGLYGGGTIERFRGRGLYRAVVAARARKAMEMGARYLTVDALPTSRPILETLGFVRLTDTWPCCGGQQNQLRRSSLLPTA